MRAGAFLAEERTGRDGHQEPLSSCVHTVLVFSLHEGVRCMPAAPRTRHADPSLWLED